MTRRTFTEHLADRILAREGLSSIWELQVAAANAHRMGHPDAASVLLEVAEVIERERFGVTCPGPEKRA